MLKFALLAFVLGTFGIVSILTNETFQFLECPSISNGGYPYCVCKYGDAYDNVTNTCPNPTCPHENAKGNYPNCSCTENNHDYSAYLNECFRVCPESSTGYWPSCVCDNSLAFFDKRAFKCVTCPPEAKGVFPNCVCGNDPKAYDSYRNECIMCGGDSSGEFPNCVCRDNSTYVADYNWCYDCPFGSHGRYPDCICDDGAPFDNNTKFCKRCSWDSVGTFPDCVCNDNGTFVEDLVMCYSCPAISTGQFPNCVCPDRSYYEKERNLCVECPENAPGMYPDCACANGWFSKGFGKCIECPVNTTGIYPDCECEAEGHEFSAYINECFIACPENASGIHPTSCRCDNINDYYVADEFICKSKIGRKCPADSIGVGPDCLCMRKDYRFDPSTWACYYKDAAFSFPATQTCPENGKWPQCESSIDRNALLSLIG